MSSCSAALRCSVALGRWRPTPFSETCWRNVRLHLRVHFAMFSRTCVRRALAAQGFSSAATACYRVDLGRAFARGWRAA